MMHKTIVVTLTAGITTAYLLTNVLAYQEADKALTTSFGSYINPVLSPSPSLATEAQDLADDVVKPYLISAIDTVHDYLNFLLRALLEAKFIDPPLKVRLHRAIVENRDYFLDAKKKIDLAEDSEKLSLIAFRIYRRWAETETDIKQASALVIYDKADRIITDLDATYQNLAVEINKNEFIKTRMPEINDLVESNRANISTLKTYRERLKILFDKLIALNDPVDILASFENSRSLYNEILSRLEETYSQQRTIANMIKQAKVGEQLNGK